MAHLCLITLPRFEEIVAEFCAPDPYSRTPTDDGRRLEKIEGGWCIVNYLKYRDLMQRKSMSHAERQAKYRKKIRERDAIVTGRVTSDTEAEAEADDKRKKANYPVNSGDKSEKRNSSS